jgi:2-amino-4-hydroxy-6-hydroxymethyldihydropteridine diphosphokinase
MPVTAYIGLGANLGPREATLSWAIAALRATPGIAVAQVSDFITTHPVGGPAAQPDYLNAAAALEVTLSPTELLQVLLELERQAGRERSQEVRFGPRKLDLDVLLYGDLVLHVPHLTIPHPRMHERGFVLQPLLQIAPTLQHPIFGTTVAQMYAALHTP